MDLSDFAILARTGGFLGPGDLAVLSGDDRSRRSRPSPDGLVALSHHTSGTWFGILDRPDRAPDGLLRAGANLVTVQFKSAADDLLRLGGRGRHRIASENPAFISVYFKPMEAGESRELFGSSGELDLRVDIDTHGALIAFEGAISLGESWDASHHRERAHLVGEVRLPATYFILRKWKNLMPPVPGWDNLAGPWKPTGTGLGAIPISPFGKIHCIGMIDWNAPRDAKTPAGRHVLLDLQDHGISVRPSGILRSLPGGFAVGDEFNFDGPEMLLHFGSADFWRCLGENRRADIELRGDGIGLVQNDTYPAVREGRMQRQPIEWIRLSLDRGPNGLRVRGVGGLAPLPNDRFRVSLGPGLRFDFVVPRTWLLAGQPSGGAFYDDWRREFGNSDAW
jgi:hypothetical protein